MKVLKKIVIWVLAAAFTLFIALFSLANRDAITLDLWPLELTWEVPLFALLLACVGFGIFWGGFAAWLSAGTARRRAREAGRRADALEADLAHAEERNARLESDLKALRAQTRPPVDSLEGPTAARQLTASSSPAGAA